MKLEFLKTMLAVLEAGNFATAAKRVNLSSSAVSLQIRQLESYFGQTLFERTARICRPTPFAIELADAMHQTLDTLASLRDRAKADAFGRIRLAAVEPTLVTLLPEAIRRLHELHPTLELQLGRGRSSALIDDVKVGKIDAAIVIRPQRGASRGLRWYPLQQEKFVLLAPADANAGAPADLLRRYSWIRLDRDTTGGMTAAHYVTAAVPGIRCAYELPSSDAVIAMVSAGVGVAVLPMPRVEMLSNYPLRIVSLGRSGPTRQISMVCRQREAGSRKLQVVLEAFESAVNYRDCRSAALQGTNGAFGGEKRSSASPLVRGRGKLLP